MSSEGEGGMWGLQRKFEGIITGKNSRNSVRNPAVSRWSGFAP